jgi:protoporphyrinogen oxidase
MNAAAEDRRPKVVVVGGGFTGLAAAYQLCLDGMAVTVVEQAPAIGGLAASFRLTSGDELECFYHHWFTSDGHIMSLISELAAEDELILRRTRTGVYYANRMFRLATPLDLLKFSALSLFDRLRLAWLAVRVRMIRDWRAIEHVSAEAWLRRLGGDEVYRVVWEPLLRGKFGALAPEVSAVWIWNKLVLRGGSRGRNGAERLAYFRGGFSALVRRLQQAIEQRGGRIVTGTAARGLEVSGGRVTAVVTRQGVLPADAVILTPALPIVAKLLAAHLSADELKPFGAVSYLANVCLILELDRSLSDTYWLNVNDPSFPFVGVIEHTNFESASSYGGRSIIYLSRYLPADDVYFRMDDGAILEHCLPYLRSMFPAFAREWVLNHHVWRARYAQPVVTRGYGATLPAKRSGVGGVYVASMAQIYPEDRGTNFAVREGREAAATVTDWLRQEASRHWQD